MPLNHLLLFAFLMFATGVGGVITRRNLLVVLMSVELMLNAVNLAFISFARYLGDQGGQVMVLMVFVVAAVEVAVGMAIVINMFRRRQSMNIDVFDAMRG